MIRSSKSFLLPAGALLLAWGILGPQPVLAQETEGGAGEEQAIEETGEPQETAEPGATAAAGSRSSDRGRRERRPLLPGSTPPPTELKWVRDHWTPWSPPDPESFPPDAVLHIIVPGDTLWDLAELAFGDPYLWPQIWNQNRYIPDSHWIYPGDPLLVPRRPTVVTEVVPRGPEAAPPMAPAPIREDEVEDEVEPIQAPLAAAAPATPVAPDYPPERPPDDAHAPRVAQKPVPLAYEVDIRCSGYIARKEKKPDYFIANQEEESKVGLTQGDIIYLNRGRNNGHVEPGTEYSIVVRDGEVYHPITNKRLGVYYKRLGTVTMIMAHEDTAIARISMACDEIRTGYDLVPLQVTPITVTEIPPFDRLDVLQSGKPTGYVVHTMDYVKVAGTGYIVEIDLGYEDGLKAGDFLTIFLPNRPYDKFAQLRYEFDWGGYRVESPAQRKAKIREYPPKIIGQMIVLTTEKRTSTVKIIRAIREIEIGDMVEVH